MHTITEFSGQEIDQSILEKIMDGIRSGEKNGWVSEEELRAQVKDWRPEHKPLSSEDAIEIKGGHRE